MRKDNKKALYESIMTSVAKEVKKVLNEDSINEDFLDNVKSGLDAYKNDKERSELIEKVKSLINNNALLFAQAFKGQAEIAQIMDRLGAEDVAEAWRKKRVGLAEFLEQDKTFWKAINLQLNKIK